MNYYASLLRQLTQKGRTKGFTINSRGGWYSSSDSKSTTLDGIRAIKLSKNNTFAWLDAIPSTDILIRHFTTDILRLKANDLVIVETPHSSPTTQQRFKEYAPWQCFQQNSELFFTTHTYTTQHYDLPFVLPAFQGLVVGGWTPTPKERLLCLAARQGGCAENLRLCASIEARGGAFVEMAEGLRSYAYEGKVQPWAVTGQKRDLAAKLAAGLAEYDERASRSGIWFCDAHTGELIRAYTGRDEAVYDILPALGKIVAEPESGRKCEMVDGFSYSARRGA